MYLVLEYQVGGTLMSKIEDQVIFSEEQAKVIMTQLLLTIDYFH
jgi:serine/threonine protein kinase